MLRLARSLPGAPGPPQTPGFGGTLGAPPGQGGRATAEEDAFADLLGRFDRLEGAGLGRQAPRTTRLEAVALKLHPPNVDAPRLWLRGRRRVRKQGLLGHKGLQGDGHWCRY